jgi:putative endonuclease
VLSRAKGDIAEQKAREFLVDNGYRILETNFYCVEGEIDIIAFKDGTIHIVEVKSGFTFEPIYNITSKKLKKIIKTTKFFIKSKKLNLPYCIDAMIVKKDSIEHIENVTI